MVEAGAGQGDEAESAAEDRCDAADNVAGRCAFDAQQVDAAVEVREHREENRDTGDHAEEVRSRAAACVHGRDDRHKHRHLRGREDQTLAGETVLVEFTVDLGDIAFLSGTGTGLSNKHHPKSRAR